MGHVVSSLAIGIVAVAMAFLAVLALGAWRRSRNVRLLFVAGAFALFFLKSALTAYSLRTGFVGHESLELLNAGFDVGIAGLLILPLFVGRRVP